MTDPTPPADDAKATPGAGGAADVGELETRIYSHGANVVDSLALVAMCKRLAAERDEYRRRAFKAELEGGWRVEPSAYVPREDHEALAAERDALRAAVEEEKSILWALALAVREHPDADAIFATQSRIMREAALAAPGRA